MGGIARLAAGRRSKWVVLAVWVVAALIAFPFQSKLQDLASDESDAFQDRNAESTKTNDTIEARFKGGKETTAVIVYTRDDAFTQQDKDLQNGDLKTFCDKRNIPDVVRAISPDALGCGDAPPLRPPESSPLKSTTDDQTTQLSTVWTSDDATESVVRDVETMRDHLNDPTARAPLRAYVTGEAGFAADQSLALEGIDATLLAATLALVLVLLLLIYRSPAIALVPLLVVGIAYLVAAAVVYAAAKQGLYRATGQATAILIVLMFGAGTDYCLLLLSRYREELQGADPEHAMVTAVRRTGPAILSAGGIVIVVMLVLSVADYNATRWMGPVLAIGTAIMVLAGITLLPALLATIGARAFRTPPKPSTLWPQIGAFVKRRPLALATAVLAILIAGALGNLKDRGTLDFAEQFRDPPESVIGLDRFQAKFPPGQAGPVDIVIDAGVLGQGEVLPQLGSDVAYSIDLNGFSTDEKLALVRVTLAQDPFSELATETIPTLRANAKRLAQGKTVLVGGPTAEVLDSETALRNDAKKIVPIALALVFVIIAVLLRSLIAPIYVIATVILSYAFALGVSALIFKESDPQQPLFTFLFLIALGVDYNVFLLTRIREERDVVAGLVKTGGVITSAGLILAGTFTTLLATELQSLFQVGFTVALGLLVDTFLVRIFLVPSIALLLRSRAL